MWISAVHSAGWVAGGANSIRCAEASTPSTLPATISAGRERRGRAESSAADDSGLSTRRRSHHHSANSAKAPTTATAVYAAMVRRPLSAGARVHHHSPYVQRGIQTLAAGIQQAHPTHQPNKR
jgi:hypothetical protein